MHWLFAALLGGLLGNFLWYILTTIALGVAAIVLVHFVLFSITVSVTRFDAAKLAAGFEYSLQRQWISSMIYLLIAVLLFIEIVVGWQVNWFGGWMVALPLLVLLVFTMVMSIRAARRFRDRHNRLAAMRTAFNRL